MQCDLEYFTPNGLLTENAIIELVSMRPDEIFFLDADKLISEKQVRIAVEESNTLMEKDIRVKRKASLLMMLLSGKRQISEAVKAVGITTKTKHVLCVSVDGKPSKLSKVLKKDKFCLPSDLHERDKEVFFRISSGEFYASQ